MMMKRVNIILQNLNIFLETFDAKPMDDNKVNYPSPYAKKESPEKKSSTDKRAEEEETKGFDFGEVPLSGKEYEPTNFEDDNFDFAVTNPTLQANHIVYHVKGIDRQGPWEGLRRFNEFYVLY